MEGVHTGWVALEKWCICEDVSNSVDSAGYIFHLLSLPFTGSQDSGWKKEDRNHGSGQIGRNFHQNQNFPRILVGICNLAQDADNDEELEGDRAKTDEINEVTEDGFVAHVSAAAPCVTVASLVSSASQNHGARQSFKFQPEFWSNSESGVKYCQFDQNYVTPLQIPPQ